MSSSRCQTVEGVSKELLRSFRFKKAAKPSWELFLVAIAQRFEDEKTKKMAQEQSEHKKSMMAAVGFEPTPPKRLEP